MPVDAVLQTKLFRPPVTLDLVPRARLVERLEARRSVPMSLISAPAGYGKSTAVSEWLAATESPSAWLSLDRGDDDLPQFLTALVAAVRTVAPNACRTTLGFADTHPIPPVQSVAAALGRDLADLGDGLILALDDYHVIQNSQVHDVLSELLRRPPPAVHLALITRHDPPLPLSVLRARGHLCEVRMDHLRFSDREAAAFFANVLGEETDPSLVRALNKSAEGWPAGLRLAATARRYTGSHPAPATISGANRFVSEFLLQEVLARQAPEIQEGLLRTSLLDRIAPDLVEVVLAGSAAPSMLSGQAFLDLALRDNLFLIPLDGRGQWFRYHHLFQQLLQAEFVRRHGEEERVRVHASAGAWFENEGQIEDALRHHELASDPEAVVRLARTHGRALLNRERWPLLDRLLRRVPRDTLERDPDLLILKAWSLENRLLVQEAREVLTRVEELARAAPVADEAARLAREIDALMCSFSYLEGDLDRCVELSRETLDGLPRSRGSERGFALIVSCLAHQRAGRAGVATESALAELRQDDARGTFRGRALTALCYVHWLEADPAAVIRFANEASKVAQDGDLPESGEFARYFRGIGAYDRDELDNVEAAIGSHTDRVTSNPNTWAHSCFALALSRLAGGNTGEAHRLANAVAVHALEVNNASMLAVATAFGAELALRQGRTAEAARWAATTPMRPSLHMLRFYLPESTYVRALVADGSTESIAQAEAFANTFLKTVRMQNHRRSTIDALILRALVRRALDRTDEALEDLLEASSLAIPGHVVRPFLDWAGPLLALPLPFDAADESISFLAQLQEDRRESTVGNGAGGSDQARLATEADVLTDREREIVGLLGERLSNKEIARRLFVSPETVKKHLFNVYYKLDVHGRRDAVRKATELNLV